MNKEEFEKQLLKVVDTIKSDEEFATALNDLSYLASMYSILKDVVFEEFKTDLKNALDSVAEKYGFKMFM